MVLQEVYYDTGSSKEFRKTKKVSFAFFAGPDELTRIT